MTAMTIVELYYYVNFGCGDSSEYFEWDITLEGKAEEAYLKAKKLDLPFEDFEELKAVLDMAYKEIEEQEIENYIDLEDEYVMECTGRHPADPETINELVAKRDPYTLEFFDLDELDEEELEAWDANKLDEFELPDVCDFEENFEAVSPFDDGWTLKVFFAESMDEDD